MSSPVASFPSFDEVYAQILAIDIKNEKSPMHKNEELLANEKKDYERNQEEIPVLFARYKWLLKELETSKEMGSKISDLEKELKKEKENTNLLAIDYEFALDDGAKLDIQEKNLKKDLDDLKQYVLKRKESMEIIEKML